MRATIAIALVAAVLTGCGKDDNSSSGGSGSGESGSALDGTKDLSADLKTVMESALATAKAGDKARLAAAAKTFQLPGHEAFFKKVFGDSVGAERADAYAKMLPSLEQEVAALFEKVVERGYPFIEVNHLTSPEDPKATGKQKDMMKSMASAVPIYTVHFRPSAGEAGISVWSWAYVDGGFRLIGK